MYDKIDETIDARRRETRETLRVTYAHIDDRTRKNINACVFRHYALNANELLTLIRANDDRSTSYYACVANSRYDDTTLIAYIRASIATFR